MLRTLAPRVYEGGGRAKQGRGECESLLVLDSSLYFIIYYGTNTIKVFINIQITEPQYAQSIIFQYAGSNLVFFLTF